MVGDRVCVGTGKVQWLVDSGWLRVIGRVCGDRQGSVVGAVGTMGDFWTFLQKHFRLFFCRTCDHTAPSW